MLRLANFTRHGYGSKRLMCSIAEPILNPKVYPDTNRIRNVAIVAHVDHGKTVILTLKN